MDYITLGKIGLSVSYLGLGGIPIQKSDVKETCVLINKMLEEGINFIDSARGYSVSESYIGEAIKGKRNQFVLATKSMARTKKTMEQDIQTSLACFGTDYIDLYQVHNPSMEQLAVVCGKDGALEALEEARAQGKIGHIGLTVHSLEVFSAALNLDWVETIMFPYNIVETQAEDLMKECTKRNIGFIVMKPLAGGAIDNSNLALRFIRQNKDVSVIIPGMYCVEEVDKNKAAVLDKSPLSEEEAKNIEQIRRELSNNFCRRCNYCQPCTVGINISGCFTFAGYFERYGLADWAMERYHTMPVKALACVECGICESRCPYQLPIREMLKKCAKEFGE